MTVKKRILFSCKYCSLCLPMDKEHKKYHKKQEKKMGENFIK